MDVQKVRRKVRIQLDNALNSCRVATLKEPALPQPGSDRTEWLLWCVERYECSMEEANTRYWNTNTQYALMAQGIKAHRVI